MWFIFLNFKGWSMLLFLIFKFVNKIKFLYIENNYIWYFTISFNMWENILDIKTYNYYRKYFILIPDVIKYIKIIFFNNIIWSKI